MDSTLGVRQKDLILLFVSEVGECDKCMSQLEQERKIVESSRFSKISHFAVLLRAQREIQIPWFKKTYSWVGPVWLASNHLQELRLPETTRFAVLTSNGKIIAQFNFDQFFELTPTTLMKLLAAR